jgi:predicted DNA-binding transcriptional regulator AlpA
LRLLSLEAAVNKSPRKSFPKPPNAVPLPAHVKPTGPIKLLSKKDVLELIGVSNVTLWSMIRRGDFPPARQLGPDGAQHSKIGWIDCEVYEVLANLPRRMPKGSTLEKAQ